MVVTLVLVLRTQVIYVNRFSQSSRKHAVNEIKVKSFYFFRGIYILV